MWKLGENGVPALTSKSIGKVFLAQPRSGAFSCVPSTSDRVGLVIRFLSIRPLGASSSRRWNGWTGSTTGGSLSEAAGLRRAPRSEPKLSKWFQKKLPPLARRKRLS